MQQRVNPRCLEFVGSKIQELIQHGISVHIVNKKFLNKKYVGTFSCSEKSFKVAFGVPDEGMHTFLHEYAHFVQYKDRPAFWQDKFKEGLEPYICWLEDGVKFRKLEINSIYNKALELELDAETIALGIIASHNLPIDLPRHIYSANINLLFYPWSRITRRWDNFYLPMDVLNNHTGLNLFNLEQLKDIKYMKTVFKKLDLL